MEAGWYLSLYPDAAEAGGSFRGLDRPKGSGGFPDDDPERSGREAGRRAVRKVRRYCAANGLNRLGTLTYRGEGCHDPLVLRADVARFWRQLARGLGSRFPYVWVPEWHPGGHGLHVQFGVGRFIGRRKIEAAWGHGFIHIKLLSNLPVGSGVRAESRATAAYLSKYVTKAMAPLGGLHRYEVAQGFQPVKETLFAPSESAVIRLAAERMGADPEYVWRSVNHEGWAGPPAVWLQWR